MPQPRLVGCSVFAIIAVVWIEVSMSLAALSFGSHIGIATHRLADHLPNNVVKLEPIINSAVALLAPLAWIGAVAMAIWPPHDKWRGQAVFAVVFAPIGAILRLPVSRLLNPKISSFPLGTFTVNVIGTCVLGVLWDLQHSSAGESVIACQLL